MQCHLGLPYCMCIIFLMWHTLIRDETCKSKKERNIYFLFYFGYTNLQEGIMINLCPHHFCFHLQLLVLPKESYQVLTIHKIILWILFLRTASRTVYFTHSHPTASSKSTAYDYLPYWYTTHSCQCFTCWKGIWKDCESTLIFCYIYVNWLPQWYPCKWFEQFSTCTDIRLFRCRALSAFQHICLLCD